MITGGIDSSRIQAMIAQLRAHHAARLDELHTAVVSAREPQSAADVVPVLFRRPLDLQQRYFAMGEAIAHLNHLWRTGRLQRTTTGGGIRFAA